MNVLITGGAGFLGQQLARVLLASAKPRVGRLVLADIAMPPAPAGDPRLILRRCDLAQDGAAAELCADGVDVIFHLAAVMSGQAEEDFDRGMQVNVDVTRSLLDAARATDRRPIFVFSSSIAVYSQPLPGIVGDGTAVAPRSSYGVEKAVGELMVAEYGRRGYIDARVARLPTISVRTDPPNRATSSFASGIIREPLDGRKAVCPVDRDLVLWLSSPRTVIANLAHYLTVPGSALGDQRIVNLPGISVSVAGMIAALERVAGRRAVDLIEFRPDPIATRLVSALPARFDISRALKLGFRKDEDFEAIIREYLADRPGVTS